MNSDVENIAKQYKTPYKLGIPLLTGSGIPGTHNSDAVDCPFVFYHNDKFHMLYVGFDGKGYQTGLAVSDDLLHWEHKGVILKRDESRGWDRNGAAGTWILRDTNSVWDIPRVKKVDGRYWMVYHAYPQKGYEEGPAEIGIAWTEDEDLLVWNRSDQPVYSWRDGAEWEHGGLYKACIIEVNGRYHMFYNAKTDAYNGKPWIEQTGVAFSEDLFHWERYEFNPILKVTEKGWDCAFASDPFVVKDADKWLMFYYGFDGNHAQEGLAVSNDLLNWTKYEKPILYNGSPGDIDEIHAHKPSVIFNNGVLYHYYCACRQYRKGDVSKNFDTEFRCITVATSKPVFYGGDTYE